MSTTTGKNNGNHPLHFACILGKVDVVEYLLSNRRTDATKRNKYGWIPMMLATKNCRRCQLLSVFAKFGHTKSSILVDEFVKVGILGHSNAGKTTFSNVINEYGETTFSSRSRGFLP